MPLIDNAPWERLHSVIRWSDMTTNHFAAHVGLASSENLYRIKRGLNGISRRLAETIVEAFPEIDYTWLITGRGVMLTPEALKSAQFEFYDCDVEHSITMVESLEPQSMVMMPSQVEADFAMLYMGHAMGEIIPPNSIVLLKRVTLDELIFGKEYLVESDQFSLLRVVRSAENPLKLRLRAVNQERYDDILVSHDTIRNIYRVTAKVIINS